MLQKLVQCKNFLILKNFSHHIDLRRKSGERINHFVTRRLYCSTENPSSSIWLQVLQSGGKDAAAGLYIFADSRRYMLVLYLHYIHSLFDICQQRTRGNDDQRTKYN